MHTRRFVIDPTAIGTQSADAELHSKILYAFLKRKMLEENEHEIKENFEHKFNFTIQHNGQKIKINEIVLTNKVVFSPKSSNQKPQYSVIANNLQGRGAFGGVYDVVCKLIPDDEEQKLIKSNTIGSIDKIQTHEKNRRIDDDDTSKPKPKNAANEARLLSQDRSQRSKKIVYSKPFIEEDLVKQKRSHIISRKHSGKSLDKILKEKLSDADRLQISLAILLALKEFHLRGLIHRDIKPANIMVYYDQSSQTWKAKMIDFGLSTSEVNNDRLGTPGYSSPEVFFGNNSVLDQKSDLCSIGIVLGDVLKSDARMPLSFEYYANKILKRAPKMESESFPNIFNQMVLENNSKEILNETLSFMTAFYQENRCSTDDAIKDFDQVILDEIILKDKDEYKIETITSTYWTAVKLRNTLNNIAYSKHTNDNPLEQIDQAIHDATHELDELDNENLKIFIQTLGVDVFNEAESVANIKAIASKITHKFTNKLNTLLAMQENIENELSLLIKTTSSQKYKIIKRDMENLLDECNTALHKDSKRDIKLDELAELNNKWKIKIHRISSKIDEIKNKKQYIDCSNNKHRIIYNKITALISQYRNDESNQLKIRIASAIQKYLDDSLTDKNIQKHDRAARADRIQSINDILDQLELNNDEVTLKNNVKNILSNVSKGKKINVLGLFEMRQIGFRSQLRRDVLDVINKFDRAHHARKRR